MADETDEITVNPQVMLIENVLSEIAMGRLRVPRFERPFVWRPDQMLDLFDSIERGYPIGSLLVWDTGTSIPSLDRVADIDIPPAPSDGPSGFLLDGHQRVSTLFGCLTRRSSDDPSSSQSQQQDWMWDIYRVLGDSEDHSNRFRHWRQADAPPPEYLPMHSVLRTMDFLAYTRRLSQSIGDESVFSSLIAEAEQLAQRIKSYQVSVVHLKGGELRHALEVFSRLNSSGQSMTPDQMVSALTYRGEGETLSDRIDAIREELGGIGYGHISPITIFRSILAVAGEEDVQYTRWDRLATRIQGKLAEAVNNTSRALRLAVSFLQEQCGVPLARLIPYQLQVMLLIAAFHENPDPSPEQRKALEQWFWGTSWSGFFASANTIQVRNSLADMKDFAAGNREAPWEPLAARPFPDYFDFRSTRVRAYILWELRNFRQRLDMDGKPVDPVDLLARSLDTAYQPICTGTPNSSNPANRIIFPTPPGISLQRALLKLPDDLRSEILESHGIPAEALSRLARGDGEGFINQRAAFLTGLEADFITAMGIEPSAAPSGEADIDTE